MLRRLPRHGRPRPGSTCLFALLAWTASTAHANTPAVPPAEIDAAPSSDQAPPSPEPPPLPRLPKAVQALRASKPPRIDGKLDDDLWAGAHFVSDFVQREPIEGGTPRRKTEVALAYDDSAVYIAARLHCTGPDDVASMLTRRDDTGSAERFVVSIDTLGNHRTAHSFAVTASGVRVDYYHPDDSDSRDYSFDPVWNVKTHINADNWVAEMRIPLTQLRFADGDRLDWRVNFSRSRPQDNEDVFWVAVPKDQSGWSSWFGAVEGIEKIPVPSRVEIVPYVAASAALTSSRIVNPEDPFARTRELDWRAGVDARLGLGAYANLDLTILPDFGQVEADPAVVNLSDFEVFLDERRPFFTESNRFLEGRGPGYYFSRRIGGRPRGSTVGDFSDIPNATPILGAGKLIVRTPNGLTVGGLSAITGRAHAETFSRQSQAYERVTLEPITSYNVMRAEKQLGASRSVVGVTGTAILRNLPSDVRLADELAQRAFAGGADFDLSFADNRYRLSGDAGASLVTGTPEAIARLQRSSARYFQRPDQRHISFDGNRTSLLGWRGTLRFDKVAGKVIGAIGTLWESPGFELNEMGRLPTADDGELYGHIRYRETDSRRLQSWELGFSGYQPTNFALIRMPTKLEAWNYITFRNFWSTELRATYFTPGLNDDLTRGGPLVALDPSYRGSGSLAGRFGPSSDWRLAASYQRSTTGTSGWVTNATLSFNPLDRMRLSVTPRYTKEFNTRQYVSTLEGGRPETFDSRYIFASIDRNEMALQMRLQLSFTPGLAVELYAEPFASSGRFYDYGEVLSPRSNQLIRYGRDMGTLMSAGEQIAVNPGDGRASFMLDNPDFTQLSLRSTAVLRWEFAPGSTLHVVYQLRQDRSLPNGEPLDATDLGGAFNSPGHHSFGLKLTYWWSSL